jgi:hypothetical protein
MQPTHPHPHSQPLPPEFVWQDWQHILLQRAAELVPGGRLVVVVFAVSPEGHWLGHTDIGPCMYGTMHRLWRAMCSEGRITQQECEDATFINYYRTREECLKPFVPGAPGGMGGQRALLGLPHGVGYVWRLQEAPVWSDSTRHCLCCGRALQGSCKEWVLGK